MQRDPDVRPPSFPSEPATIVDAFLANLEAHPAKDLYTFTDGKGVTLTWSRLAHRAFAVVDELRRAGVVPGDRVVLVYPPDSSHFPAALWGCLLAGAVAVPVAPAQPLTLEEDAVRFSKLVRDCGANLALTETRYRRLVQVGRATRKVHGALRRPEVPWPRIKWLASDRLGARPASSAPLHSPAPGDLAYLQYTSGSTSDPKGVAIRHEALLHNVRAMGRDASMSSRDVLVGWVPWFHDMGLVAGFFNVAYHAAHYVSYSPLSFLADPASWMRTIHEHRATCTAAPNFGYALATRRTSPEQVRALDLSGLRLALLGGEVAPPETLRRFAEHFAPAGFHIDAFRNVYGMAEAVLYISGIDQGMSRSIAVDRDALAAGRAEPVSPLADGALELLSVDAPHPDSETTLQLVRDGVMCGDGEVGEFWIASPSVAGAYYGHPDRSAETFDTHLPGDERSYLRTGDLGFRLDGHHYICGRQKDLIIVGGRNVYPEDVELAVQSCHPGIRPGCVAVFGLAEADEERVVVACEVRDAKPAASQLNPEIVAEIRRAVARTHKLSCRHVLLLAPRSLPKTTSGKVQRSRCRELWRRDKLPVLYEEGTS